MKNIVGVDIGGTKCAVVLGSYNCGKGKADGFVYESTADITEPDIIIIDRIAFPTEIQKGFDYTLGKIAQNINEIINRNGIKINHLQGIGISCGGPLDSKRGTILSPPNLYGWDNIPIVKVFEEKLGIKTKLQNDANACALAEWRFGVARGYSHVIFLTFGTGMGAGLILNGRLYGGANDMAGEIGHVRLSENGPVGYGKAGSFEGFCSGGGIAQLAKTKVLEKLQMGEKVSFCEAVDKLEDLNAKVIGDAAQAGDELAREIYRISGKYLGKGLSILIDILNPEIIVIGSIFARSRNLLWPVACEEIKRECLSISLDKCKVVPAGLGEKIGDYAALAVAAYEDEGECL